MKKSYWLFKTEPETYSFQQLIKDKKTHWNGVRNFQARNNLRAAKEGDLVIIYHSGDERAAVGVAEVVREAYPDLDPKKPGDWVQIDIVPVSAFKMPIPLAQIKADARFKEVQLIKQSRLSVMPLQKEHFDLLRKLGESK